MKHIPRAQPRNCMLLDSCLCIVHEHVRVYSYLQLYLHAQRIHRRLLIFNFAGKEELCCCSNSAAIVCILFIH